MTVLVIMTILESIVAALNRVSCEGVQNLLNLGGSIAMLNELLQQLSIPKNEEQVK